MSDDERVEQLVEAARRGDEQALADAFTYYRPRLNRMVEIRLDSRLRGRIDPGDVLQEAFVDIAKDASKYFEEDKLPFFIWLRLMVSRRLMNIHRTHLGTLKRNASREVSIHRSSNPNASSAALTGQLAGKLTSASRAAIRAEAKLSIHQALESMDEIDREILVLRHLEELSNKEAADALGLSKSAASNRYIRALTRLNSIMSALETS